VVVAGPNHLGIEVMGVTLQEAGLEIGQETVPAISPVKKMFGGGKVIVVGLLQIAENHRLEGQQVAMFKLLR